MFPLAAELGKAYVFKEDKVFWQSIDSYKDVERVKEEYKNKTNKPWGYGKLIILADRSMVKELYIRKGYMNSLHYHPQKDENIHVNMDLGI